MSGRWDEATCHHVEGRLRNSIVLARCDRARDGSVTLRLHIRLDGGSDTGEYIIEIPAWSCDGASGDAFREFGADVHDAYYRLAKRTGFSRLRTTTGTKRNASRPSTRSTTGLGASWTSQRRRMSNVHFTEGHVSPTGARDMKCRRPEAAW
jgi:hypothetical protein